jgi:membrane protease subunit (stomatin/prohibitin family)
MARIFDVVEFVDERGDEMVHRIPERGSGDFRIGSQVIVRESQAAVFFRDGKALDVFDAGRHTITTANIPLLIDVVGRAFSDRTPFTAEVYYVSIREFLDMKWGTPEPITVRDPVLRMARLRAFGTFAAQISDPQLFVTNIVGTQGLYRTADVEKFLRSIIITKLTDLLGESGKSILDLPAMIEEFGAGMRAKAADDFAARGMNLTSVYIESISPTEETAKAIDEAAAMGAIGDMGAYMQFQAARAMRDAAQSEGGGGVAGAGVGLGAGAGMGMAMAQMMSQAMQSGQQPQQAAQQVVEQAGELTPDQLQAALDNLDVRLANGDISEEMYTKLSERLQSRIDELKGG